MKKFVLIVAGGKGLRMGGDLPKQFIPMNGKPVLMHTLETFYQWDEAARLILVLPEEHQSYWKMLCKEIGCGVPHEVVNGGETRFHSVRNGLEFLSERFGVSFGRNENVFVGVHDGVRPFVSKEVITACFEKAQQCGNAIPVMPMIESLRELDGEGSHPVDRSRYIAVQTPQVFSSCLLLKAYKQPYSLLFTDDASVVEAIGEVVHTVEGNRENIKITTPFDLLVANAIFADRCNL
ncbi:2-C-methyl-D-erythritol 4-phosphate cytidylyltransferase [Parabacteroides chinchillae]